MALRSMLVPIVCGWFGGLIGIGADQITPSANGFDGHEDDGASVMKSKMPLKKRVPQNPAAIPG